MAPRSWAAIALVVLSGCYSWVPVRPTELPLLNDMHNEVVGQTVGPNGQVTPILRNNSRTLHRPDGRTVSIGDEPSVRIHTTRGTLRFDRPVDSSLQPGQLLSIAGSNRAQVTIPLQEIELAEASRPDRTKTMLAITLPAAGASVLSSILILLLL
jgi:hypothetical protein